MMRRRRACLRVMSASWNEEKRLDVLGETCLTNLTLLSHLSQYYVAGVKKRGFARADKTIYVYILCVCVCACACVFV